MIYIKNYISDKLSHFILYIINKSVGLKIIF